MKDYSQSFEEQQKYILSYKIEDDEIIIKLANKEYYSIPYTIKNENKIIDIMETQASKAKAKKFSHKKTAIITTIYITVTEILFNYITVVGFWPAVIISANFCLLSCYSLISSAKQIKQEEDVEKLMCFLEYKKILNDNIKKSKNILLGVSKEAVEQINLQQNKKQETFNINNIDNYSLEDLKKIINNIKRFYAFNFYEKENTFDDPSEKKEDPVLKKTLNK